MIKIKIDNLHKKFGHTEVLRGFSLDIYSGEIICILGKSGTGKSVIMKHLVGILEPDSGIISVDDETFTGNSRDIRSKIISKYGILFQGGALFDSMNIYDNVAFGLRRKGLPEEKIEEIVKESLYNVGLSGTEQLMPSQISGGMQKRAALARSIAVKPEIMIYDEPTTGVDPITAGAINRLITRMRDLFHITSIVVTHDIRSAFKFADRIAILEQGKVIQCGKPDEIAQSKEPFVMDFIGKRLNKAI